MQQFTVPQFIEVEDKIFGPVTTRQFLIIMVAGIFVFLAYKFGDFALFITVLASIGGSALVLAFVKVNGQPFHFFLVNIIQTLKKPSRRIWRKQTATDELNYLRKRGSDLTPPVARQRKQIQRSRIRDLSLVVNTGGFYRGEDDF